MMTEPLYFFVHLPKTAGQSVIAHLHRCMDNFELQAARYSVADLDEEGYVERLLARGETLRLVHGHRVSRDLIARFAPRPARPVVVLRDPVDYLVSLFNYDNRDAGLSPNSAKTETIFSEWLGTHTNHQARWLVAIYGKEGFPHAYGLDPDSLRTEVRAILDGFWCIGDLAKLEPSLGPFFKAIGATARMNAHRNRAGSDYPRLIDKTAAIRRDQVLALNPVDAEIHRDFAARSS